MVHIENALAPVHGIFMRDVNVQSVHPTCGLFGWHCYRSASPPAA
jgi:hypothetical protein